MMRDAEVAMWFIKSVALVISLITAGFLLHVGWTLF